MKITTISAGLLLALFLAPADMLSQNKYIGMKACIMCHKTEKQGNQQSIWEASNHAKAFKTLMTDRANAIAAERGLAKPAAESPECLSCHVPQYDKTELFEKGFDKTNGVQCESCHSAGSAYKTLPIMKDKAKAVAAGLTEFKNHDDIKALCVTCHNDKSPTFKEFNFEEMWNKIKHPVPKK